MQTLCIPMGKLRNAWVNLQRAECKQAPHTDIQDFTTNQAGYTKKALSVQWHSLLTLLTG